jgi:large repetitive protein
MRLAYALVATPFLINCIPFTAQAADCSVPNFQSFIGQTVNATMTVKAGKTCSVRLNSSMGGITETRIVNKPAHGAVSVNGTSVVYKPKPRYTGVDQFTYARDEVDRWGKSGAKTVVVMVTITP